MEKIGSTMQFQFHTSLTAKISFVTVFCYKCEENRFLAHPWFQRVTTFACHKNDGKQFPGYKPLQMV